MKESEKSEKCPKQNSERKKEESHKYIVYIFVPKKKDKIHACDVICFCIQSISICRSVLLHFPQGPTSQYNIHTYILYVCMVKNNPSSRQELTRGEIHINISGSLY